MPIGWQVFEPASHQSPSDVLHIGALTPALSHGSFRSAFATHFPETHVALDTHRFVVEHACPTAAPGGGADAAHVPHPPDSIVHLPLAH